MTLVPNETEQALNRQYDVYAAAREEYRKKIAEQASEIERLREELSIWKSVFPDIAPRSVLPDRSLLEAENARLRAALREIAKVTYGWEPGVWSDEEARKYFASLFFGAQAKARAALEGRT